MVDQIKDDAGGEHKAEHEVEVRPVMMGVNKSVVVMDCWGGMGAFPSPPLLSHHHLCTPVRPRIITNPRIYLRSTHGQSTAKFSHLHLHRTTANHCGNSHLDATCDSLIPRCFCRSRCHLRTVLAGVTRPVYPGRTLAPPWAAREFGVPPWWPLLPSPSFLGCGGAVVIIL